MPVRLAASHYALSLACVMVMVPAARAAVATGWNQSGAGPYDFNTTGNWVGGTINGTFDSTLTLTNNQSITLAAGNTTIPSQLLFNYGGNYDLTIASASTASRTLNTSGDITFAPASTTGRTLTFGGASTPLAVTVSGTTLRTISASAGNTIVFNNIINMTGATGGVNFGSSTNTGTIVLNATENAIFSGTFATLNGGTLVFGVENTFGTSSSGKSMTVNAGTIQFVADNPSASGITGYRYTLGGDVTFVSDRTTTGAGVNHYLSTISTGTNTATLKAGGNVTSGQAGFIVSSTTFGTGGTLNLQNVAVTGSSALSLSNATLKMTIDSSYLQNGTNGNGAITLTSGTLQVSGTGTLGKYTLLQASPGGSLSGTPTSSSIADTNYRLAITSGNGGTVTAIHKATNTLAADSATTLYAHKGDASVALGVHVKNSAPTSSDAFTYNLSGNFGTVSNASRTAGGTSDAGDAYTASIGTGTAGVFTASATATPTDTTKAVNGTQTVTYNVHVNDYAAPSFGNASGATLSGSGTAYTLDFGKISGNSTASIRLINALVSSYQDSLGGTFDLSNLGNFTVSGLSTSNSSPLAAGSANNFSISTSNAGSGYLLYTPTSLLNGSPTALSQIRIDLVATAAPEPALLGCVGLLSVGMLRRRR